MIQSRSRERIAVEMRHAHRRAPPAGSCGVDVLESLREATEIREHGLRSRLGARRSPVARRPRRVARRTRPRARAGRRGRQDRRSRSQQAFASSSRRALPPGAGTKTAASASVVRRASGFTSDRVRARSRIAAGIVGRRVRGAVRASTTSQPGSVGNEPEHGPGDGALAGRELDDDHLPLRRGGECRRVDTERDRLVVTRKPFGRSLDRGVGGAEQRVDAGQELRPLVLAGRDGDALGGEECRGCGRLRLQQRRRGKAREARLEPVNDVERADRQRGSEVGAHAHGQRDPLRQRGRDGGADGDDVPDDAPLEGPAAFEQVGGA